MYVWVLQNLFVCEFQWFRKELNNECFSCDLYLCTGTEFLKFDVYIYGTIQFRAWVRYLGFSKVSNIFEQFQAGYLELFFLPIKSLNLYLIQMQISKIVEHQSKIKKLSRLPNERINFCPMLVLSQARVMFYGDKISNENLSSKLKLFLFLNKLVCMRQAHA